MPGFQFQCHELGGVQPFSILHGQLVAWLFPSFGFSLPTEVSLLWNIKSINFLYMSSVHSDLNFLHASLTHCGGVAAKDLVQE